MKPMTSVLGVLIVVTTTCLSINAKIIDLSHVHNFDTIMAPNSPKYSVETIFHGAIPETGVYYRANTYRLGEHGGTHVDVPNHFSKVGKTLDKLPLEATIGEGVMVDCSKETGINPDYQLTVERLKDWEKEYGQIPRGSVVVLNFNWSHRFSVPSLYFNTKDLNDTDSYRFPHISKEAAEWLVDERDIKMLAFDSAGPDRLKKEFPVHVKLASKNKLMIENLNNPHLLPAKGFQFFAPPVKFTAATGVQVRAFAIVSDDGSGAWGLTGGLSLILTLVAFIAVIV